MNVVEKQFILLPPKPGLCPECAVNHPPELPHNPQSLYWQVKFSQAHKRLPTWGDALAHCDKKMRKLWVRELGLKGVKV